MIIKFKSIKLSRSFSKLRFGKINDNNNSKRNRVSLQQCNTAIDAEVKWELRPGGMLVQKREIKEQSMEGVIVVRVVSGSKWHDISIQATSTFGELKMILSMVTSLDPKEQRVLFKGKEREEEEEYLHMVGVRDKDKVLMLQDPATKEKKLVTNATVDAYHTVTL